MKGLIINIDQEKLQQMVSINMDDTSVQTMIVDSDGRFISCREAELLGWYFVGVADSEGILEGFVQLRSILVIVSLILFVAGVGFSIFFINRIYSPISTLTSKTTKKTGNKQENEEMKGQNEYEYLEETFKHLFGNTSELEFHLRKDNAAHIVLNVFS